MDAAAPGRKRPRRPAAQGSGSPSNSRDEAISRLKRGQSAIVFSGAGMSASAGLPTFQALFRKVAKKRGGNGMQAFHYRCLEHSPHDSFDFFMRQFFSVQKASPTEAHETLRRMETNGQLIRHYTMNIDGLGATGSDKTLELHGNLGQLVCRSCGDVFETGEILGNKSSRIPPPCPKCDQGTLRFRVLLYEDREGHLISTANPLEATLQQDLAQCQLILWVGVSFQQSASCEHFRMLLQSRSSSVPIYIVSPEAVDAMELLQTVVGYTEATFPVPMTSDEFFKAVGS